MTRIIIGQWIVLGVVALVFVQNIDIPIELQLIPLLISALVLGLPHGAVDHLVPGWVRGRALNMREMALLLVGYVGLIAAVLALWLVAPVVGFVFFILLTWWHWGLGDLYTVLDTGGERLLRSRAARVWTAGLRGSLPMIVPLIFFPGDYRLAATEIVALFNDSLTIPEAPFSPAVRAALLAGLTLMMAGLFFITLRHARTRDAMPVFYGYVAETLLLFAYFAVVPPFLAVGIYFCVWHSLRHILRLITVEQGRETIDWRGFWQFTRGALPLTLVALVMLAGLYLVFPNAQQNWLSLVSLYLALIAALTLPHTVIVMWLDARQHIWQPARQS